MLPSGKTWKLRITGVAALKLPFPACVARIEQVPGVTSVTAAPLTVQTPVVNEAKLTGNPDEAAALSWKGGLVTTLFGSGLKVIVWLAKLGGVNS